MTPDGSGSIADQAPSLTNDEARDYLAERTMRRINEICGQTANVPAQMMCVRDETFRGFDTTGEARRHCDMSVSLAELMRCAVIGSVGYELAVAAGLPDADAFNWQDPKAGLKHVVESLGRAQVEACGSRATTAFDQCILDGLATTFSLSDRQVATCTDTSDRRKSLGCLMRVYLIERFESGIARMGQDDGLGI